MIQYKDGMRITVKAAPEGWEVEKQGRDFRYSAFFDSREHAIAYANDGSLMGCRGQDYQEHAPDSQSTHPLITAEAEYED